MKEQIIKIFKDYEVTHGGLHIVADEIVKLIDQEVERRIAETIAGKFIEVEIEKRIAERMPSEEEIDSAAYHYGQFPDFDGVMIHDGEAQVTFAEGAEWLRSRLTSSGKPNNSEGGKV